MTYNNTIYVFSGFSSAGKDTAASVLTGAVNVKWAAPGKRALEAIYKLPEGFMDDRVERQTIAPHSGGKTYLEVLINFWRHRDLLVGSELFGYQTKDDIMCHLAKGEDIAITDMRNFNELDVLMDIHELGFDIIPIWIDGGEMLESDVHQGELFRRLCTFTGNLGNFISNDSPTAEDFKKKVEKYLTLISNQVIM